MKRYSKETLGKAKELQSGNFAMNTLKVTRTNSFMRYIEAKDVLVIEMSVLANAKRSTLSIFLYFYVSAWNEENNRKRSVIMLLSS